MRRLSCSLLLLTSLAASAFAESEIVKWNKILLQQIADHSTPPPLATRSLALLHVAQFEAINTAEPFCRPYLNPEVTALSAGPLARSEPAAAQAAFDVLAAIYPDADLNTELTASLSMYQGTVRTQSIALGAAAALAVLLNRTEDGSAEASVAFTPPGPVLPGQWIPTPPQNKPFLLPGWGKVVPWALSSGSAVRPPPPPGLVQFTEELDEVRAIGSADSQLRTAEQTEIAQVWVAGAGTVTPPGMWFQIAHQLIESDTTFNFYDQARLFALIAIAQADSAIACWDAKRFYNVWRPVTAINDPAWSPLLTTPPFPAYVSGHSTFSGASAEMLAAAFGGDVQPEFSVSDGTLVRRFTSLTAAAEEAGESRIYGGIHFQSDNVQGLALGRTITNTVLAACAGELAAVVVPSNSASSNVVVGLHVTPDEINHRLIISTLVFACVILLIVVALFIYLVVTKRRNKKKAATAAAAPGGGAAPVSTEGLAVGAWYDVWNNTTHYQNPQGRGSSLRQHSSRYSEDYGDDSPTLALCGLIACCLLMVVAVGLGLWFFGRDGHVGWGGHHAPHHRHFGH